MTDVPLFEIQRTPIAREVDSIIEAMNGDPVHARDRRTIVTAIIAEAHASGGRVDPNRLRARLVNEHGRLTVYPRLLPAVIGGLVARRVLLPDGHVRSTDRVGRNTNKLLPKYRLAARAVAA